MHYKCTFFFFFAHHFGCSTKSWCLTQCHCQIPSFSDLSQMAFEALRYQWASSTSSSAHWTAGKTHVAMCKTGRRSTQQRVSCGAGGPSWRTSHGGARRGCRPLWLSWPLTHTWSEQQTPLHANANTTCKTGSLSLQENQRGTSSQPALWCWVFPHLTLSIQLRWSHFISPSNSLLMFSFWFFFSIFIEVEKYACTHVRALQSNTMNNKPLSSTVLIQHPPISFSWCECLKDV